MRGRRSLGKRLALATSALLAPAALMAFALASWRVAADLRWSEEFAISDGIFSHWQVWIAMAFAIEACSVALARYGARMPDDRSKPLPYSHSPAAPPARAGMKG